MMFYLMNRYELDLLKIIDIRFYYTILFISVSLFTWLFTAFLKRRLVIFIGLIFTTPALLLVSHAELFLLSSSINTS